MDDGCASDPAAPDALAAPATGEQQQQKAAADGRTAKAFFIARPHRIGHLLFVTGCC